MTISDNLRGAIYMNLSMFAFTVNDSFMKAVTHDLPLFQTITMRGCIAVSLMLMLAVATGGLSIPKAISDRKVILLRSLADVVATVFFLKALIHMPLANLSAVMQAIPLAVTLGAALVYKDRIGWRRMTAIVVGFAGVLLIIRPGTDGFDVWSVVGLGSVLSVVVRDLLVRRLGPTVPSIIVALGAAVSVALMGAVGSVFQGWQMPTLLQMGMIFGAGTMLPMGYICSVTAMRVGDIGFVAPFRYTSLLWAIVLGWVMFAQLPDLWAMIGASIVVATGIYTLLRERKLRLERIAQA